MNHYVPDFDMDDEHNFNSTSSTITRHKVDDEILELLWQDGQVVAQPQNQRKPTQPKFPPPPLSQPQSPPPQHHLYMAEDEMATWLHYPLEDLYSELLCENQPSSLPPLVSSVRQPEPPPSLPPRPATCTTNNFGLFSRMRGNNDLERTSSIRPGLTVVESNTTPALGTMKSGGEVSSTFPTGGCRRLAKNDGSGEVTLSSSSGTSGGDTIKTGATTQPEDIELGMEGETKDRKRKQKEIEESNTQIMAAGQDLEHEADNDEKKNSRGHSTAKRSRAAEVHNLSERRRRDRINDRMKALQELIPRCNKSDKASMLDEAIEYLKSLQMQVQMMSMGCNMVPMMYPGMQQYMSPMGMDMRMARPMMPFPPNIPGSNLPLAPGAAGGPQFGPRFAIPPARMPSVPSPNLAASQTGNQGVESVHGPHSLTIPPGMAQVPNMGDPYQQYMALQQMQMQIQMQMQQMQAVQNQLISQPGSSKPSTSKSEAHIGPSTSKTEGTDDH